MADGRRLFEEMARMNTIENDNISDKEWLEVSRHRCGATACEVKRLQPFVAFHTPTVRNGSPSRATICDATKMLA
jgi:hypothetical protein